MKDFAEMLDEMMDQYPQAADEIAALQAKVGESMAGEEELGIKEEAAEMPGMLKPIPKDLMDDEEEDEEAEEEAMH